LKREPIQCYDCEDDRRRSFLMILLKRWNGPTEVSKIISFIMDDETSTTHTVNGLLRSCPTPIVDLIIRFITDIARCEPLAILIDNAQFLNNGSSIVIQTLLGKKSPGNFRLF
jgi:hypothetical protein